MKYVQHFVEKSHWIDLCVDIAHNPSVTMEENETAPHAGGVLTVEEALLFVLFLWILVWTSTSVACTRERERETEEKRVQFLLHSLSSYHSLKSLGAFFHMHFTSISSFLFYPIQLSSAFILLFRKLKYYIFEFQFHFHAYKQQSK